MAARDTVRKMAAHRALEEEAERLNPLSGRGATPSMGLSQFRGGMVRKAPKAPKALLGRTAPPTEAYEQGRHLAEHLHSLHGGSYAADFHKGMEGSGVFSNLLGMIGLGEGDVPVGAGRRRGGVKTGAYEGEGHDDMEGKGFLSDMLGTIGLGKHKKGKGKLTITHGEGHDMEGKGFLSDMLGTIGLGKQKKAKRPLLEGDGRLERAKIVKEVMADKGCSMIEASKYVKEHNLY